MSWMRTERKELLFSLFFLFLPRLLWNRQNHCTQCTINVSLLPKCLSDFLLLINLSYLVSAVSLPCAFSELLCALRSSISDCLLFFECSLACIVTSFLPTRTVFLDVHCLSFRFFRHLNQQSFS